jgi:NAD(P)-dependent dehydrogenase (short-subunit alcohol dehydrogenase family)
MGSSGPARNNQRACCPGRRAIQALKAAGGTAIVSTASMMSFLAAPGMASYVAAKHAVAGLTKAAAMDLIRDGIRCALAPRRANC